MRDTHIVDESTSDVSAGSLRTRQWHPPILEQFSATSRVVEVFSHDLRLPLTAILANAEFLIRSDISEMEKSSLYQEIRCAIERMNEMVSSLLECSKGRDTLRPAPRNIVDTVERAIRMTNVRPEFRRIGIKHHHKGLVVGCSKAKYALH